jgi:hypothetical protein
MFAAAAGCAPHEIPIEARLADDEDLGGVSDVAWVYVCEVARFLYLSCPPRRSGDVVHFLRENCPAHLARRVQPDAHIDDSTDWVAGRTTFAWGPERRLT